MHLISREKPGVRLMRIRMPSAIACHVKPARSTIKWGSGKLRGKQI